MLSAGASLTLTVVKPAAGGWMIARSDGRVILVSGAIPGERVTARVERVGRDVAYARTLSVEESSPDRREPFTDPACGGCLYAHIAYPRQLQIKADVIADAFARIAGVALSAPVPVSPSSDEGYRMRARLHARNGRLGFFREATHDLCDVRGTRQLLQASCDVLDQVSAGLESVGGDGTAEIELSENADASQRVVHIRSASFDRRMASNLAATEGLTGLSASSGRPSSREPSPGRHRQTETFHSDETVTTLAGDPSVTDVIRLGRCDVTLQRHVLTFFQGNRYLLHGLVAHVVEHIGERSEVVDLYAGAGLFSVSAAAARDARVTAVEGERFAALDLAANVSQAGAAVAAVHQSVEDYVRRARSRPDTVIIDPPRTGTSPEALSGAVALGARQIVFVSCDVATLARDARRLLAAGYEIERMQAFDLFPNTPHVETVVVFRQRTASV